MNNTINSTSFGANISTTIKGRNDVMKNLAKGFAEKTKNLDGTLKIFRDKESKECICFEVAHPKTGTLFMPDYGDLFAEKTGVFTKKEEENIINKFVRIFKMLTEEANTKAKIDEIDNKIEEKIKLLKFHMSKVDKCNNEKFKKAFEKLQEFDINSIIELKAKRKEIVDKSCDKIDKYAGNDNNLNVYSYIVREDQYHL